MRSVLLLIRGSFSCLDQRVVFAEKVFSGLPTQFARNSESELPSLIDEGIETEVNRIR